MLTKISKILDKFMHDSFWEVSSGDGGAHYINLKITQLSKLMDGLGIGTF